jgi:hypothetical protein
MFEEHEPEERKMTPDLTAVERQLARLTPAAPRIDRDRLMFEAGRAAAFQPERSSHPANPIRVARYFWPAATCTMTAASLILAFTAFQQHLSLQSARNNLASIGTAQPAAEPQITTPVMQTQITVAPWLAKRAPQSGYLNTRFIALTRGVSAMESPLETADSNFTPANTQPSTRREMLNELLPSTRRTNSNS